MIAHNVRCGTARGRQRNKSERLLFFLLSTATATSFVLARTRTNAESISAFDKNKAKSKVVILLCCVVFRCVLCAIPGGNYKNAICVSIALVVVKVVEAVSQRCL